MRIRQKGGGRLQPVRQQSQEAVVAKQIGYLTLVESSDSMVDKCLAPSPSSWNEKWCPSHVMDCRGFSG